MAERPRGPRGLGGDPDPGGPACWRRRDAVEQVHVKLSGFHHWCGERYPYRDGLPYVEAAVRAFGAARCMWGSDFPHVLAGCGYVRNRNLLPREAGFLSKAELEAVMGGTAERVWFTQPLTERTAR